MTPVVSVLMTSFNREKYIGEAIESVLNSDFAAFELVILDDCSTDQTFSIAQKYADQDSRIRLYRNEKNIGQFANRNKIAGLAQTNLLKYLDSDDRLPPSGLGVMVDSISMFPNATAGSEFQSPYFEVEVPYLFTSKECYINHYLRGSNLLFIGPSGTIIRKDSFVKVGGFDESIGILADTLLMMQLAAIGPVVGMQKNLFYWREHNEQVTVGQKNQYEMLLQRYMINKMALSNHACPLNAEEVHLINRNVKSLLVRRIARFLIRTGSFSKTFSLLKKCEVSLMDILRALFRKNKMII
jgi:glycosyltransferase involved in cell wall biosynthesis